MILSADSKARSDVMKLQTRRPSLILNAVSNYASLGVNIAVGFLLTPFIINQLGKTGYGIWAFIGAFIGYYGLLNLGVGSAITRYVARYAGRGDGKALNATSSTAMAMFCSTGMVAIAVSFFIATPIAKFFNVPPEYFNAFKYMVWIMGLATGLSFPGSVFQAIVLAHERFVPANYINMASTLIRAGLVVCLLLLDTGLIGLAFAAFGEQLFRLVANHSLFKRFTPHVRIRLNYVRWNFLKMLIVYGSITIVITIADHVRMNLDSFVIGKWISMEEVGVYAIAAMLIRYMLNLVTSGMNVLTPRFANLEGLYAIERVKSIFIKSLSISSFLAFGCCMGAITFGGHFIILWIGKDFGGSIMVLWILSVSFAFALSQTPGIGLMYALNKHHFYAIVTVIEAIANLILSILLVSKYGIIGVALGTAIPMLIVKIFVQPIYVSRIIDITIVDYVKPIIPSVIISFTMVLLANNIGIITNDPVTIPYLLCTGTVACSLYIATSFLLMNKNDKHFLFPRIFAKYRSKS